MSFKKIIVVIVVMLMLLSIYSNNFISSATTDKEEVAADGYGTQMKTYITAPWNSNGSVVTKISSPITIIIAVVRIIGMCVAIVMLLVVAMKYMTSAPGDKAEIKKSAVVYVVGALVLFGAVGLLGIISDFAGNIS